MASAPPVQRTRRCAPAAGPADALSARVLLVHAPLHACAPLPPVAACADGPGPLEAVALHRGCRRLVAGLSGCSYWPFSAVRQVPLNSSPRDSQRRPQPLPAQEPAPSPAPPRRLRAQALRAVLRRWLQPMPTLSVAMTLMLGPMSVAQAQTQEEGPAPVPQTERWVMSVPAQVLLALAPQRAQAGALDDEPHALVDGARSHRPPELVPPRSPPA